MTYIGEPYDQDFYHTFSQIRPEGYHDYSRPNVEPLVRGFADDIEAQPQIGSVAGLDVLDAGCAYGYLTDELALRGANVVGIDLSAWAISQAQSLFPTRTFLEMDLMNTTFSNNTFNLVVVCGIIECMNNDAEIAQLLNEIRRIMRPTGAVYALLDYNSGPAPIYQNKTWDEWLAAFEAGIPGPWDFAAADIGHLPLYYGSRMVVS